MSKRKQRKQVKCITAYLLVVAMVLSTLVELPGGLSGRLGLSANAKAEEGTTESTTESTTVTPNQPEGIGNKSDPYKITSMEELYWFAGLVNGDVNVCKDGIERNQNACAVLVNDITIQEDVLDASGNLSKNESDYIMWSPINDFKGKFDGQGHTISGICVLTKDSQSYCGLFSFIYPDATICRVGLTDSYFKNSGYDNGAICGYNQGTIINCYVSACKLDCSEGEYAGGICGYNSSEASINNCYSDCMVNGKNKGLICAGNSSGVISNCYFNKEVYVDYAAVGSNGGGTITKVAGKDKQQFSNGEVTYLLNKNKSDNNVVWGQILDSDSADSYPVLRTSDNNDNIVYQTSGCKTYTNDSSKAGQEKSHNIADGRCSDCRVWYISQAQHLKAFADSVNAGNIYSDAVLTDDIVLDGSEWTPIGSKANNYQGVFDGNGHIIKGIRCTDSSANYVGLFGYAGIDSIISGIGIVASNITGNQYVGGLCAYNSGGKISSSYCIAEIQGKKYTGGVCGYNTGDIRRCYYNKSVYADGKAIRVQKGNSVYVAGKTAEQFEQGVVTYLLNGRSSTGNLIWGQNLSDDNRDVYPVAHNNNTVYATKPCISYTNNSSMTELVHINDGKFCSRCSMIIAPEQADGIYQIDSSDDLEWFSQYVNNVDCTIDAVLTDNIIVSDFIPAGNTENAYTGTFNGQGHTVTINGISDNYKNGIGLFGYVGDGGKITNLGVISPKIEGNNYVGGICGNNGGIISNCYYDGALEGNTDVGAICGRNTKTGKLSNCYYNRTKYVGYVLGNVSDFMDTELLNLEIDSNHIINCNAMNSDRFKSGMVAYSLNHNDESEEDVWGQTLADNGDAYPVALDGSNTVYATKGCVTYTNDVSNNEHKKEHSAYINGICPDCCNEFQMPVMELDNETSINTCEISNAGQLFWCAKNCTGDEHIILTDDIVINSNLLNNEGKLNSLNDVIYWLPVGFRGVIDGQGHTISGLYCDMMSENGIMYSGLLTGLGGTISNLGIVDSYISGYCTSSICYMNIQGTIENCYYSGCIDSYAPFTGGICVLNMGQINNCYNEGNISINSGKVYEQDNNNEIFAVAGICAFNAAGIISKCYNAGSITCDDSLAPISDSGSGMSGIAGVCAINYSQNPELKNAIKDCYNVGDITVTAGDNDNTKSVIIGGVCGFIFQGELLNSYSSCKINTERNYVSEESGGAETVGGVCGVAIVCNVSNCYYNEDLCNTSGIGMNLYANVTGCEGKTTDNFTNGEVAYLLQTGHTDDGNEDVKEVWGQSLGGADADKHPVFHKKGNTVYNNTEYSGCVDNEGEAISSSYSNNEGDVYKEHAASDTEANADTCIYCKGKVYSTVLLTSTVDGADGSDTVGTLTGGGKLVRNTNVTVTAPHKDGFTFKGWYLKDYTESDSPVSKKLSYSFEVSDDIGLVAVYNANADLSVDVTCADNAYMINDVAYGEEGFNNSFKAGSKVSVKYTGSDTFCYWKNASDKIISREPEYTFTLVNSASLTAVTAEAASGDEETGYSALVEFVSYYGQVMQASVWNSNSASEYTMPKGPSKVGGQFSYWSLDGINEASVADICNAITADKNIITLKPVYTDIEDTYTVTVSYDGKYSKNVYSDVTSGTEMRLTAANIKGRKFSHWSSDSTGNDILGTSETYCLTVTNNMNIYAIYVDDTVEVVKRPVINVTDMYSFTDGNNKIGFVVTRDVPEGYTVVETGVLYGISNKFGEAEGETALVVGGSNLMQKVSNRTDNKGVHILNVNVGDSVDTTVYVRGYILVKDEASGNIETIYSDIAKASYNSLSNVVVNE